jgi:hypothetical protein
MYHWGTYDQDMNHEPLVFLLEGGMKETPEWRVELKPIYDTGF